MGPTSRVLRRRTIRLPGYDYRNAGAYFITVCAHGLVCRFGEVVDGVVRLNAYGDIVADAWCRTPVVRPNVALDAFVVMPNHFHAIILLRDPGTLSRCTQARFGRPVTGSLGSIVGQFKAVVTKRINSRSNAPGVDVWQRNYHERIIRTEEELNLSRHYIDDNPAHWSTDRNNPLAHP